MNPQELLATLQEGGLEALGLYYGRYPGVVVANEDPSRLGRLRVRSEPVFGQTPVWARPAFPCAGKDSGLLAIPDVGDGVWLTFQMGRLTNPIWSGAWAGGGELPSGVGPGVHAWRTKGGQEIRLEESGDRVTITSAGGAVVRVEGDVVTVLAASVRLGGSELTPLDGVVTRACSCAYTGGPHPVGSGVVLAKKS